MDVNHTETLNVKAARNAADERHMCPLSLDVIRRGCVLYSNPDEVVFSPFAGVGSEGVGSLKLKRRFLGVELKREYFEQATKNLEDAANEAQTTLFGGA